MINKVIKVIVLLVFTHTYAQNTQWKSYFSYNEIRDISTTDDKVIVATDNAIFSKNTTSGELKTFTSVDGFKPYDITTLYYSDSKKIIFVGNSNGLFQIITADNKVINKQHIISEIQVSPVKKKINHIFEHQNKIYLSCDFGIVVFNTDTLEFGDTLFIGTTGGEIKVNQTALFNGNLYAATAEGIKYCSITDFYINTFFQNFGIGYKQIIANQLDFVTNFCAQICPASPITFVFPIFDRDDWVTCSQVSQVIREFISSEYAAFTSQIVFAIFVEFS